MGLENPVRQGQRYRVSLPIIDGEVPLAGFVELEWSSQVEFVPLPPAERLKRLLAREREEPEGRPIGPARTGLPAVFRPAPIAYRGVR